MPISAVVLPRAQWEAAKLLRPYGLPVQIGRTEIAVPALGDRGTVRRWQQWLGTDLPPLPGRPLRGTVEEASSLGLADVFLQCEVAAIFVDRLGLAGDEPWIRGLLAHLVALTLFETYEPSRRLEIEIVYRRLANQIPPLLEAGGEERQMPVERWLLSEAIYHQGARLVFSVNGSKTLKRVLKARRKGGPLTGKHLLGMFPQLTAWLSLEARASTGL